MLYSFEFDEFDNPMHLSKVGNWVFTFLSPQQQIEHIQLAITNVIPRQVNTELQTRRLIIEHNHQNLWNIMQLECFDGLNQKEILMPLQNLQVNNIFQDIIHEFAKYDVEIKLHSIA